MATNGPLDLAGRPGFMKSKITFGSCDVGKAFWSALSCQTSGAETWEPGSAYSAELQLSHPPWVGRAMGLCLR